ncbi:hypothetical protein [Alicyclobacillus sp. ALC3]|uniref:hypothetical protein n=1 Tax=Alicyclobacillus sp. ALC3 TaxID=2796143 RepID=UPI0023796C98|nr:hypothetical protein [Alicyclobacillus sp. ALC3]WDL97970.1 hypothetical protein JC200_04455 [Alicyclobacillus sp. ALC3]
MSRHVPIKQIVQIGTGAITATVLSLSLLPSAHLLGAHHLWFAQTAQAASVTQAPVGQDAPRMQPGGASGGTGPQPVPSQPTAPTPGPAQPVQPAQPPPITPTPGSAPETSPSVPNLDKPWPRSAKLRVKVIDGRTLKPLAGAEVVVIESEQRLHTDVDGQTPWFDAPLIRDPRYRPLVQELHGQLGVIAYKNGYRDSVHMGIRLNPGVDSETTVWMYKLGPGDVRIEPVLYQEPFHHLWLIRLADRYRDRSQLGEGFQKP